MFEVLTINEHPQFMIRLRTDRPGKAAILREPIIGHWYCGIEVCSTYAHEVHPGDMDWEQDGELMRYEGAGVWSRDDGDSESEPQPGGYDYLQEQQ